jgi:anthranilate phosphoribosyltransferase
MLKPYLKKLAARLHLTRQEAEEAMNLIMEGLATPAQIGAFVFGLRMKGETVDEVAGCAAAMRSKATPVHVSKERLIDTCGTGGDGANTFNISTAAAFVACGAGARVAKHGNRAVSSRCGSADVMEALGVQLNIDSRSAAECLEKAGIAFLFAPNHHGAMKHAAGPRKEIGIRTVFNILGPLSNPAGTRRQLIGVYAPELAPLMAEVLLQLGSERALVVHSSDGLDEISIAAPTLVAEVKDGRVGTYEIKPEDAGLSTSSGGVPEGGTPEENAALIRGILEGRVVGPARDVVVLNAGAALVAAGAAGTLADGAGLAASSIDSGEALARLERLVAASRGGSTE